MARRLGIELSRSRCAIADLEVSRGRGGQTAARLRKFVAIPWSPESPGSLIEILKQLRESKSIGRHAAVAMWGLRSSHQLLTLPPAKDADLNALALREARRTMPILGEPDAVSSVLFDNVTTRVAGAKRDVSVVAASGADVRMGLAPLVASGFTVDAVVTAPVALASLAAHVHPNHDDGAARAYVAVNAEATAVAVVRNGLIVFCREIPLRCAAGPAAPNGAQPRATTEFAERLGAELKRSFLFLRQQSKLQVREIYVCGEIDGIRLLTAPLIHALDVEVETLDSPEGLAAATSDGSAAIRDFAGDLRMSWAVGDVGAKHAANLLPIDLAGRREAIQLLRRSVAGVAAAGLVLAGSFVFARTYGGRAEARAAELRAEIARLEPRIAAAARDRADRARAAAQLTAIDALSTPGPRLARILELVGQSAPPGVVLQSISVKTIGHAWEVTVKGKATGSVASEAQAAFNQFLRLSSAPALLGPPVRPPHLAISSSATAADLDKAVHPAAPGAANQSATGRELAANTNGWVAGGSEDIDYEQWQARLQTIQASTDAWAREQQRLAAARYRPDSRVQNTNGWVVEGLSDPWEITQWANRGRGLDARRPNLLAAARPTTATPAPAPAAPPRPITLLDFTVVYEAQR